MNLNELDEKLTHLLKYIYIRIDLNNFSDSWFISFEDAYNQKDDERYSIFIPHYCKSMQIVNGVLAKSPSIGIGSKDFPNVVCYKFGNYSRGKFYELSPWISNPSFDPEKCQLYKPKD